MSCQVVSGQPLVTGVAAAPLLVSDIGLSFWGGVDPVTGLIIDQHHPLVGKCVANRILAMPSGRGSSSASGVLLELILNDHAPAGLLFTEQEALLTLGVVVAEAIFDRSIPVLRIDQEAFATLKNDMQVRINQAQLWLGSAAIAAAESLDSQHGEHAATTTVITSEHDKAYLRGEHGKAAQVAMKIVLRMAEILGAPTLMDVSQAHIDGCVYNGTSSLRFARQLADWGARVCIPTTLNSLSVDVQQWRAQGVDPELGEPASELGFAYQQMGAQATFTCAPYLLDSAPRCGEQIVWAESNAVVYANSVLGARTLKYPDFLDICIALTGRAPASGCHLDAGRFPSVRIDVETPVSMDEAFWPLLGHLVGQKAANDLPLVFGLEDCNPSQDDLKAYCAAFATTSSAPMCHIAGLTAEAKTPTSQVMQHCPKRSCCITLSDLQTGWQQLNTSTQAKVDQICLGNPHLSLRECEHLATLCEHRSKHAEVVLTITLGRAIYAQAQSAGYITVLERFGVTIILDTCWCMIREPIISTQSRYLMTNSGKYAHYAPGLVNREIHFDSMAACVEAACVGWHAVALPKWLS